MKKGLLLNSGLSRVISLLGHGDILTVADAGLPLPNGPERIDLAIAKGLPTFMQVVEAVTWEMQIEKAIMAAEIKENNAQIHQSVLTLIALLQRQQGNQIEIEYVAHSDFKNMTTLSKAAIRTGECSPFSNVHLIAGVTF